MTFILLLDLKKHDIPKLVLGKHFVFLKMGECLAAIKAIRYFAGWADKHSGSTIDVCILHYQRVGAGAV